VAAGEKAVVGVKGSVEQVLAVKLLKDQRIEEIGRGLRIAGMGRVKLLEALHRGGIIEVVEALIRRAHLGIEVHGVGVHGRGHDWNRQD
jgi:hypothetical protein